MSTTTVTHDTDRASGFARGRLAFRHWRGHRPFWAGLFTMAGAFPIIYIPYAQVTMGDLTMRMGTTGGASALVIGVLLVALGLSMWFQPATRVFSGVATLVLALLSLVLSNVGGGLAGFLLALFGGGMSIAWVPVKKTAEEAEQADGDPAAYPAAPVATAPGTGSALAGFPSRASTQGKKGKHRAE